MARTTSSGAITPEAYAAANQRIAGLEEELRTMARLAAELRPTDGVVSDTAELMAELERLKGVEEELRETRARLDALQTVHLDVAPAPPPPAPR